MQNPTWAPRATITRSIATRSPTSILWAAVLYLGDSADREKHNSVYLVALRRAHVRLSSRPCPQGQHETKKENRQHEERDTRVTQKYNTRGTQYMQVSRRRRWLGRLSSCLLKSIQWVQFSPSAHTREDFFLHLKLISGKRESVS